MSDNIDSKALKLNIEGLMDEYNLLVEVKKESSNLYNTTKESITNHLKEVNDSKNKTTTRSTRINTQWKFMAEQTSSLNSIQKTIIDCIKEMNGIKRQIIELKMKEYNLYKEEDSTDYERMFAGVLNEMNKLGTKELYDTIDTNLKESKEKDDSEELMAKAIDSFEDEKKKDVNKEISEVKSSEQNLKALLEIYHGEIEVVFFKKDDGDYEWIVIDNDLNQFEKDDIKELYKELYLELRDLEVNRVDEENYKVYDQDGNKFDIIEIS